MADAASGATPIACFAPCPRGLEEVLADELRALGSGFAKPVPGGVHFTATWPGIRNVNLRSRIASRVLVRVAQGRYRDEDDVQRLARATDWTAWFDVGCTLRVDTSTGSGRDRSGVTSLDFVNLKIKDGVCDAFRDAVGSRPSIDRQRPDVRVFAYLDAHNCTLYLDTTGDALFKRGWRTEAGIAPLRENLAAGILALAGWHPGTALLDPMCGSGTFVVEAAQAVLGLPPGGRRAFGFERLKNFDADAWRAERPDTAPVFGDAALAAAAEIRGSDVSGDAVAMTRANLERAGVPDDLAATIAPKQIDARQVRPHADAGIVVANPPYGERIAVRGERGRGDARRPAFDDGDAEATTFFAEFGDTLKRRFAGWTCHVLTPDLSLQKKIRLSPDRRVVLFNGPIECRLFRFALVAGFNRGTT